MPAARQNRRLRQQRVRLSPGVWVRQSSDGQNLCKVPRCKSVPQSLEPIHRGLCVKHYVTYADERPICKQCSVRYSIDPWCDQLCEFCSGQGLQTTPFEAQVLEEIRKGATPVAAVQTAMGPGTSTQSARRKLDRMSRSQIERRRMRRAMEAAGITDDFLFRRLKKNIGATKLVFNNEGESFEVDDVRGSNQALDIVFKLQGRYPGKERPEPAPTHQTQVNVAVLPAEEARRPDTQVYTLPIDKERLPSGGDD